MGKEEEKTESPKTDDSQETAKKKGGFVKDIFQIALFVLIALVFRSILLDHYVIPSGSMIPTLMEGDRVVVSKISFGLRAPFTSFWLFRWSSPKRGDIVVFSAPTDGTTFIKRVVGVPGDVVAVRNGTVIINGTRMKINEDGEGKFVEDLGGVKHRVMLNSMGGPDFGPAEVPDGHYFMLGDNRGNSQDSRFWGFLSEDLLLGYALRIYYRSEEGFSWQPL